VTWIFVLTDENILKGAEVRKPSQNPGVLPVDTTMKRYRRRGAESDSVCLGVYVQGRLHARRLSSRRDDPGVRPKCLLADVFLKELSLAGHGSGKYPAVRRALQFAALPKIPPKK